jgi:hypothetical protein
VEDSSAFFFCWMLATLIFNVVCIFLSCDEFSSEALRDWRGPAISWHRLGGGGALYTLCLVRPNTSRALSVIRCVSASVSGLGSDRYAVSRRNH